jgi:4-hydroxy-tetrahydrodipicolinate reductase
MKLAVIGKGAMGKLVAAEATKLGDEVGVIVASAEGAATADQLAQKLQDHDVAIDFSTGEAVPRNVQACLIAGVPLVEGTTGWKKHEDEIKRLVQDKGGTLVFGANFSIGVNVFYRIVSEAAKLFSAIDGYEPFIEEMHHSRKRDAPSGTALRLGELMTQYLQCDVPTSSTRAGYIPGTHRVGFDSEADQLTLTHTARSRQGFAAGALLAARWVVGRKGVYEFGEVVDEILSGR